MQVNAVSGAEDRLQNDQAHSNPDATVFYLAVALALMGISY